jgi:hypothetical protein
MPTGDVELTVLDGGAGTVVVPASSVAVVIGTCSGGTAAQVVASRNANTLATAVGYGPAVVQAAMLIKAGGTVLFMKSATTTPGTVSKQAAKTITGVSLAAVITSTAHGLSTGDVGTIAGVVGAVEVNVTGKITVLSSDTFTVDGVTVATAYVSGGTFTPSGVRQIGTGTSIISASGAPYDSYLMKVLITNGGTTGVTGIRFKLSADAGRTYGPEIALGTAITYAVTGTGLTLNFVTAKTLVLGDYATFGCVEPLTSDASVQACLNALEASPYSVTGWRTLRICGPRTGASASLIQGYLDALVALKTWTRAIIETRDNNLPGAYGGGVEETDAVWAAAVALDYSAVSARRVSAYSGNYNMDSIFPIAACGTPVMRRNLAYALAARQVTLRPQNHAGRVADGALTQIIVDPTNDPTDGFNYHDEFNAPSIDVARIGSARKRKGKPGYFIVSPRLLSPPGSVFTMLPLGDVIDIGCSLCYQTGEENINADVQLNTNGTIEEKEAQRIEMVARAALRDQMFAKSMISGFAYTIDRTNNVRNTSEVNFSATLFQRGYILQINGSIGYGTES